MFQATMKEHKPHVCLQVSTQAAGALLNLASDCTEYAKAWIS